MNQQSMEPFGMALEAYFSDCNDTEIIIRRDDGWEVSVPIGVFFKNEKDFTSIENKAIELCKGEILDVGAGTGAQSLILQNAGHPVTAIDINPQAVNIMREKGLKKVFCRDVFEFHSGPYDTLLLLGHGIGMVENIEGLKKFLKYAGSLISSDGQIILDSLDVRQTSDPINLAYQQANRKAGKYIGEIKMQFEFRGNKGPYCGWLQVDEETLNEIAKSEGWKCEIVLTEKNGDYLAKITK